MKKGILGLVLAISISSFAFANFDGGVTLTAEEVVVDSATVNGVLINTDAIITSATAPIDITNNVLSIATADTSTTGALTSTDWNTFNDKEPALTKGDLTETTSDVLAITGGTGAIIGSGVTIEVDAASSTSTGTITATEFNTFNGKADVSTTGGEGALQYNDSGALASSSTVTFASSALNVGSIAIPTDENAIYIGTRDTESSWKLVMVGTTLEVQRYDTDEYVKQGTFGV